MKKRNLFICMTPFQLFFATKIIESEKIDNVTILLLDLSHSEKNYYYLEKAKNKLKCETIVYQENKSNKILKLLTFLKFILLNFLFKKFDGVYLASLHDKYIHILLNFISFNGIYSFDDGVANINKDGIYFKDDYIKNNIIKKVVKHYTIYSDVENIVENSRLKLLNIFDLNTEENDCSDVVIFFIGQPYNEMFKNEDDDYIVNLVRTLGVNYYFRHPREKIIYKDIEYIESMEIFESFLEGYVKQNPDKKVIVYSFFSSVMFNIVGYTNVDVIAIGNDELYEKYNFLYKLMAKFNMKKLWLD